MRRDIAIIGGSAAGLFAARLLSEGGLDVRVFEANEDVRSSARTLIVTRRATEFIGRECEAAVLNEIKHFELFADGRVATVPLTHPDLVIERSKLTDLLAEQARAGGAEILTGHRFREVSPNGGRLTLTLAAGGGSRLRREKADVLIAADGAFSRVGGGDRFTPARSVFLLQAVVKLPPDMDSGTTRVWFLPDSTPFFFWLIPHSSTHGVIGLIAEDSNQGQWALKEFLSAKGLAAEEVQAGMVPLYHRWTPIHRRVGGGDIYLVGDSAGHVKPTTVGGVVTGFRGALGVVEAILQDKGGVPLAGLRTELGVHSVIRRVLYGFTQTDYVRLLDLLNPKVVDLLGRLDRDRSTNLLLSLCAREPRILSLGLRSLLSGFFKRR